MRKRTLCLLMTLLIGKTNAFCQDSISSLTNIKRIEKGSSAPYTGVLLSEDKFRFYVGEAERAMFQEEHLSRLAHEVEQEKTKIISIEVITALIVGGAIGYLVKD